MTYTELLKITEDEKKKLKRMKRNANESNALIRALCEKDIKKLPNMLALFFLNKLSDNIDSIIESVDDDTKRDLIDLYMRYEDKLRGEDREISIDELPTEAIYS